MHWKIGFMIWWKGLVVMAIPCIFFLIFGLGAITAALLISWPAIFFYTAWLWICKQSGFSHITTLTSTIFIPAPVAIVCSLWLFHHFLDETTPYHFSIYEFEFLGPLFCCILGVFLSSKSIYLYLHPNEAITAFTID